MERAQQSDQTGGSQGGTRAQPEANQQNAAQLVQDRRKRAADAHNAKHPRQVAEFNRLTKNACGAGQYVDFQKVWGWQSARGITINGKIDEATLEAARKEPKEKGGDDFFEGEGVEGEATKNPDPSRAGPRSAKAAEKPMGSGGGEDFFEGEGVAASGDVLKNPSKPTEAMVAAGNTENQTGKATETGEDVKQFGKLATFLRAAGIDSEARRLVLLPRLVELASAGKWKEVIDTLSGSVSLSDITRIVQALGDVAGVAPSQAFEALSKLAPGVDVAIRGLKFQYEALLALGAAKAAGKQDNRALKYAEAWANTILYGEGAHVPADLPEQVEAVTLGRRDALDTLAGWGDQAKQIGDSLLKQYGSAGNAKRALIDELLSRAGFTGIKLHEGG
jgi:hypothetical protein